LHILSQRVLRYTEAAGKLNDEIRVINEQLAAEKEREAEAAKLKADPELSALQTQLDELKSAPLALANGAPIPLISGLLTGSAAASAAYQSSNFAPSKPSEKKAKEKTPAKGKESSLSGMFASAAAASASGGDRSLRERAKKEKTERLTKLNEALARANAQAKELGARASVTSFYAAPSYVPRCRLPRALLICNRLCVWQISVLL
jgi:hypothetical protein